MIGIVFLGNRKIELHEFPDPIPGRATSSWKSRLQACAARTCAPIRSEKARTDFLCRRTRTLRGRGRPRPRRLRTRSEAGRPRDGAPLRWLRRLSPLPNGLDPTLRRRIDFIRLGEGQRRTRALHESTRTHSASSACRFRLSRPEQPFPVAPARHMPLSKE